MKLFIGILVGAFAALVVPLFMIQGELGDAVANPLLLHGAFWIALTYGLVVVAFASLVPSVVKGRALSAPLLFGAALTPFFIAVLTFAGRHHRDLAALAAHGISAAAAREFAYQSSQSEAVLAIGALATTSTLIVAASMGIGLQITSKLKGTLALLGFTSSGLFASVYTYALAERDSLVTLLSLPPAMPQADRVQAFADASITMTTAIVFGVIFLIALALVVAYSARRAPGFTTWLGASAAMLALVTAPWLLARGDDARFERPDPGAIANIHIPTTRVGWDDARAHHQKIIVDRSRATQNVTAPDASEDAIDLVVDGDVQFGFLNIVVARQRGSAFALYVAPPSDNRADVSELGALGTFLERRTTSADVHFTEACTDDDRVVIVDGTSEITRNGKTESWLLMGPQPSIADTRRDAFKAIVGLSESPLYIAARDTDTLATIWEIADAAREATGGALHIVLTTDRRTSAERAAARRNP